MMISKSALRLNERGQAMVETAFVIGLLVLLIFGMTEFGRAMYTKNTLNNAARAGVRVAVVTPGIDPCSAQPLNSPCGDDAPIFTAINNSIVAAIKKDTVNVSVQILDQDGNPTALATGVQIKVTVQAGFEPVLNIMKSMISETLTGEASMRFE